MTPTYDRPFLLCVGAQESATIWLAETLRRRTPVWVGPFNAMHYFDRYSPFPAVRALGDQRFHDRLVKLVSDFEALRDTPRGRLIRLLDRCQMQSDADYVAFLHRHADKAAAAADLTPDYATLREDGLQRIKAVVPQASALFMMRDPVARLWAHARQRVRISPQEESILTDLDRFLAFFSDPVVADMCDYPGTIRRLRTVFPAARIAFFEDILKTDATALVFVNAVLGDLGLDPVKAIPDIRQQAYSGREDTLPDAWAPILRERLDPVYEGLKALDIEIPKDWR